MPANASVRPANADIGGQLDSVPAEAAIWIQGHWLEIALASGAGFAIYLLLHLLRRWGLGLCRRGDGVATWYSIAGRAIAKTSQVFMILTAMRLVIGYADAPTLVHDTVFTLFTVVSVFQAAIWVREVVFGAVEHRTRHQIHNGQAISSALGIIRLLVTIAIFSIAVVVVLSNLGVDVTGLVAGLGVGGIAIGLAAQGIFADLFAALAILFDRPFQVGDAISYDKGAGSGTVEAIGLKSTRIRGAAVRSAFLRTSGCWTLKSSTPRAVCTIVLNMTFTSAMRRRRM
jgi:small-conductance mechanosensitive channel